MNNKRLGTAFERRVCEALKNNGYWVHFIAPDARGAQPFDVIAVKRGFAMAIDCKTCAAGRFNISRLEDNQVMAFERWLECGNDSPVVAVEHEDNIYVIPYTYLKNNKSVKLDVETQDNMIQWIENR